MTADEKLQRMWGGLTHSYDFVLGPVDTDSISIAKTTGDAFTKEEQQRLIDEINSLFPEHIVFSHDGYFDRVIVLKAKNYVLYSGGKIKLKGSSLRSSKTEKALKEFMSEIIDCLLHDKYDTIINIYHKYVREVFNIKDISRWTKKITVTKAVLNPTRTTEQRILEALMNKVVLQMGDKHYLYFVEGGEQLKLQDEWSGDEDKKKLLEKLYKTLVIFENVININDFPNYKLVKNQDKLKELVNG